MAEEHTIAYKLFHYYFEWEIPESFANEKRMQFGGVPISTDSSNDHALAESMVRRQHTVIEMIDYSKRGARIVLCHPEKSVIIYEWLTEYLTKRREQLRYKINVGNVPLEDLTDMDEFASIIYRLARQYENTEVLDNGKSARFNDNLFKHRMLKSRFVPTEKKEDLTATKPIPEHKSISDDISKEVLTRNISYKRSTRSE